MPVNQHASVLAYARKLKNFNFLGASDVGRVNSQRLYSLVKMLRMFQKTDCLNFLPLAFIKVTLFVFHSV